MVHKKIHLCHYKDGKTDLWEIIDEDRDYIGAWHNGKVSQTFTEDVMQADSLTDLLCRIWEARDDRFYVFINTLYPDGSDRYEKYPYHMSISPIAGYIRRVVEGIIDDDSYGKSYVSELWVRETDTIRKVHGFDMKSELFGSKTEERI